MHEIAANPGPVILGAFGFFILIYILLTPRATSTPKPPTLGEKLLAEKKKREAEAAAAAAQARRQQAIQAVKDRETARTVAWHYVQTEGYMARIREALNQEEAIAARSISIGNCLWSELCHINPVIADHWEAALEAAIQGLATKLNPEGIKVEKAKGLFLVGTSPYWSEGYESGRGTYKPSGYVYASSESKPGIRLYW